MSELPTGELLATILEGISVDRQDLEALTTAIDAGGLTTAAATPDVLATTAEFTPPITCALMAAFEIARRAALPQSPAIVSSPDDVAAIARREVGGLRRERVIVIVCDSANRLQRTIVVSDGSMDRSLMPVREILNAVLRWDGRAFAIAHNHPCGDPMPSNADTSATHQLESGARVVGLRFLGHVVLTGGGHQVMDRVSGSQISG